MVLRDEDYVDAAKSLECEVRAIKAVTAVESHDGAFDQMGRPFIRFERHHFSRLTLRRYDARFPSISCSIPGGYDFPEPDEWVRLQEAFALNASAALKSASWGMFQIMGFNYVDAGFCTVDQLVREMCQSAQQQLDAFVALVKADPVLLSSIQQKDWTAFAIRYNGVKYWKNHYDTNLAYGYSMAK